VDPDLAILSREEIARVLSMDACIVAVRDAFVRYGRGEIGAPGVLGMHAAHGGFHIKAALWTENGHSYFAAKVNANFPQNPVRRSLPTIQGLLLLFDAEDGRPLAVMDSIEITVLRTAAATAVAAEHLARKDADTVTICGCGVQASAQLLALSKVLPVRRAFAYDADAVRARWFAENTDLGFEITPVRTLVDATLHSDVIVTCTTSRQAFLGPADVKQGTFIAAVGADNPEKQEIEPALLARSKVVADVLEQCVNIGDLHHAIAAGAMKRENVYAELGELASGKKIGRASADEITIFDSTGTAFQDAAAAVLVYKSFAAPRPI
jgi:alanine dehydrogenase